MGMDELEKAERELWAAEAIMEQTGQNAKVPRQDERRAHKGMARLAIHIY